MVDDPSITRPKIRGPVKRELDKIIEEYEYRSYVEAIRHVMKEAGYDV